MRKVKKITGKKTKVKIRIKKVKMKISRVR